MKDNWLSWYIRRTIAALVKVSLVLAGADGTISFLGREEELKAITSRLTGLILGCAVILAMIYVWVFEGHVRGALYEINKKRAQGRAAGPKKRQRKRKG
jgi:hypothetical protein